MMIKDEEKMTWLHVVQIVGIMLLMVLWSVLMTILIVPKRGTLYQILFIVACFVGGYFIGSLASWLFKKEEDENRPTL